MSRKSVGTIEESFCCDRCGLVCWTKQVVDGVEKTIKDGSGAEYRISISLVGTLPKSIYSSEHFMLLCMGCHAQLQAFLQPIKDIGSNV